MGFGCFLQPELTCTHSIFDIIENWLQVFQFVEACLVTGQADKGQEVQQALNVFVAKCNCSVRDLFALNGRINKVCLFILRRYPIAN